MEIPVKLFLGFLEAGKTRLIQQRLECPDFDPSERTLVVCCEEGIEEFNPEKFAVRGVAVVTLEGAEEFTMRNLVALAGKHKAERVIIEYNGMWEMDLLAGSLPRDWPVEEVVSVFDAGTFMSYNQNMRQLVYEKIVNSDIIFFNRFKSEYSKPEFHKIVRGISRQNIIVYEDMGGNREEDDIEDPLPFDVNAPVIEIADKDYAWFYSDLREKTSKYVGKTVRFKGMAAVSRKVPKGYVVLGRFIMQCCEADIDYYGLPVKIGNLVSGVQTHDWLIITAKIAMEYNSTAGGTVPVLVASKAEKVAPLPPEEEVTTFY